MEPVIKELEKTYRDKVIIKTINLTVQNEENYKVAMKYRIRVVPTFIFLDVQGNVIKDGFIEGSMSKSDIQNKFKEMGVK